MSVLAARLVWNDWIDRLHARAHSRRPGVNGPDDSGCRVPTADGVLPEDSRPCPECAERRALYLFEIIERAEVAHAKYAHGGTVQDCQSPHDVICKAVPWR